jgi:hypothetical protein
VLCIAVYAALISNAAYSAALAVDQVSIAYCAGLHGSMRYGMYIYLHLHLQMLCAVRFGF